jgi:hypothetical protein
VGGEAFLLDRLFREVYSCLDRGEHVMGNYYPHDSQPPERFPCLGLPQFSGGYPQEDPFASPICRLGQVCHRKANELPEGSLFSFKSELHEFGTDEDGGPDHREHRQR